MTSCVIFGTVSLTTSNLSMLPFARPGTLNPGVFVRMNSRVGLRILIVYGPMPGIVVEALNGDFAAGVGARVDERDREQELAVGRGQLDRDLAGLVVGRDARDVGVGLLGLDVLRDALDAGGERGERAAEVVQALDRVLEVADATTGEPSEYFRPERSLNV